MAIVGNVMPDPKFTGLDSNGDPVSSGKLYAYAAGTTTPLDTYTDSDLATPNANPVVLDSAGRATVFLSSNAYKFVLKTSADVAVWTQDNVSATTLTTLVGEAVPLFGNPMASTDETSYPSGTTLDKIADGTTSISVDSGDLNGSWALRGMLRVTSGTATAAFVNLSDGAPDTAIVTITSTSTTGELVTSSAISFASSGSAKTYAVKMLSSAQGAYVFGWGFQMVRTV